MSLQVPAATNKAIIAFCCLIVMLIITPNAYPQYYSKVDQEGFVLTKYVSDTIVNSGRAFQYHVTFSIPAGATNITISDQLPNTLQFVSASHHVNQNCAPGGPVTANPTLPVGTTGGLYRLDIPNAPCGAIGSFTLVVQFPAGVTCDRTMASNRACISYLIPNREGRICTDTVRTIARAQSTWDITKSVSIKANQGGDCPNAVNDSIVHYCFRISKSPGIEGQLDLYNAVVTDMLPANATILSSSCPYTGGPGGMITWNVGNLPASYYSTKECCFTVLYPRATYPIGSTVTNRVRMIGSLGDTNGKCGRVIDSAEVCSQFKQITNGRISKWAVTNGQPGCAGSYFVRVCNTGNTPLNNVQITDVLPIGLDYVSYEPATLPAGWTATYTTGNRTFTLGAGSTALAPGACVTVEIKFTIATTLTPQTMRNCAVLSATGVRTDSMCYDFSVTDPRPVVCLAKTVCNEKASYAPGEILTYRLRIQNIGGKDLTAATITDALDRNLEYIGNVTSYSDATYNVACGKPSNWGTVVATPPSGTSNTVTFTLPTIPYSCNAGPVCGQNGTGVPFYFIEFQVKVSDSSSLGSINNTFTISGGGLTAPVTSNIEGIVVTANTAYWLEKDVRAPGTTTWSKHATVAAGDLLEYRLRLHIPVATPQLAALRHVSFVELLPMNDGASDKLLMTCAPRNSLLNMFFMGGFSSLSNPAAASILQTTATGFPSINTWQPTPAPPNIFNGGCSPNLPSIWGPGSGTIGSGTTRAGFYFNYGAFVPGGSIPTVQFTAKASDLAAVGDSACNTFVAGAAVRYIVSGGPGILDAPIAEAESGPACITIKDGCEPRCDSMRVVPFMFDDLSQNGMTFKILNRKNPAGPIRQVLISLSPAPLPGSFQWTGGSLSVDGSARPWPIIPSGNPYYSLIDMNCVGFPAAGQGGAAVNEISFNLGVVNTLDWSGVVTVKTIHCDGDTCTSTYDWCAKMDPRECPADFVSPGTLSMDSVRGLLAGRILIRGNDRVKIAFATILPERSSGADVFATGAQMVAINKQGIRRSGMAAISHSSVFASESIGTYGALIEFGDGIQPGDTAEVPIVLELPAGSRATSVKLHIRLYDENGNIISIDSTVANGQVSVEDVITGASLSSNAVLYNPEPTPTTGAVRFAYWLSSPQVVQLELFDMTGLRVAEIETGRRETGQHTVQFDTAHLPSGTYMVRLSTPAGTHARTVVVKH